MSRDGQYVYVTYHNGTVVALPISTVDWDATLKLNPPPTPTSIVPPAPTPMRNDSLGTNQSRPPHDNKPELLGDVVPCLTLDLDPIGATQLPDQSWKVKILVKANVNADFAAQPVIEVTLFDKDRSVVGQARETWPTLRPTEYHTDVIVVPQSVGRPVALIEVSVPEGCPGRRDVKTEEHQRLEVEAYATAEMLYQAFSTNVLVANRSYGGKRIEVSGYIADVDSNWDGSPVIRLYTGYRFEWVTCTFDRAEARRLESFKTNMFIILVGRCTLGLPVTLVDCKLP
jgi:hypothetical protein